jgi:hypothetical protein
VYHVKFEKNRDGDLEMRILELDIFVTVQFYPDSGVVEGQVKT